MTEQPHERSDHALSFGAVADAYDRARPSYPRAAAEWLVPMANARVLELGAGTGKLTEQLVAIGHDVLATDPLEAMLRHLRSRLPDVASAQSAAEQIPVRSGSVDVVVGAQSFHWFDTDRALPEIVRVLRPGGHVSLAWNLRDDRVPWVRRLGALIGTQEQQNDPTNTLLGSGLFGYVEAATFRFWQRLDLPLLRDLIRSRSNVAVMTDAERDRLLRQVDELYADYGRGPDGMLLPYLTHCYRAVVKHRPVRTDDPPADGNDTDGLLIDFP
jgi:SAM-dependent methyltransferase